MKNNHSLMHTLHQLEAVRAERELNQREFCRADVRGAVYLTLTIAMVMFVTFITLAG